MSLSPNRRDVSNLAAETYQNIVRYLESERTAPSHWEGKLSGSALSTATAIFALQLCNVHSEYQQGGLTWLVANQNDDGGWGDTIKSVSNISTTALCWAALAGSDHSNATSAAETWLTQCVGSLDPGQLSRVIADRYGKDRTFSVPILTMLALAGRLGSDPWQYVPQLPFELAALPFPWFRAIRLPVVSYALPALIAIGIVRHHQRPSRYPLLRALRNRVRSRTLTTLKHVQPTTGGYLEATPLTSFVVMSLAGAGQTNSPVIREAISFLTRSMRSDGSWPIDTNLATWVTTLTVTALGHDITYAAEIRQWILAQQYRNTHAYTHAPPGGWAWTPLTGGVPDGDDTPGALLALSQLCEPDEDVLAAVSEGCQWLMDLQNSDGGIPTFCRGWGNLPFDRSSTDLTAHTVLAWQAWRDRLPTLQAEIDKRSHKAIRYLIANQRPNGAWAPLWFGNQHSEETTNLTYGTARVLRLAASPHRINLPEEWVHCLRRGADYLLKQQLPNGGWGGGPGASASVEETGVALEALSTIEGIADSVLNQAVKYLADTTEHGTKFDAEPIGFYFANLWYYEQLYPAIFAAAGLRAYARRQM